MPPATIQQIMFLDKNIELYQNKIAAQISRLYKIITRYSSEILNYEQICFPSWEILSVTWVVLKTRKFFCSHAPESSIFFNEPNLGNVTPKLTDPLWETLCSHKSKIQLNDLGIQFLFWSHTIMWPYLLDQFCVFINNTSYHTLSSASANSVQMCLFVEVFIKTPENSWVYF